MVCYAVTLIGIDVKPCAFTLLERSSGWSNAADHRLDRNVQARMVSSKQAKGGKEIPTPDVRVVPSYSVEYLPVHKEPRVYIRGKGRIS